ncbi:MAG: YhdP family protein, partial [Thiobacillus sp.]
MKFPPFLLALPRRTLVIIAWLISSALVLFAMIVALMYFWLLPNIGEYREPLANLMSRALGQRMTVETVSGTWEETRPHISLRGVRLYDKQNRPALYLEELDASFAWRSLLVLQPRFNHIELIAPAFTVRRTRDGNYYVGGIPVNPADPSSDFSDWLLQQGRVHISRATLAWRDEVRGAPELVLRDLDFTLHNRFNRHTIEVRASPPTFLAMPMVVKADLRGRSVNDLKTWSGVVQLGIAGASLAQVSPWIDLPYTFTRGWGASNIRLEIARGQLQGVALGLNVRDVSLLLRDGLPPLQLAQFRGSGSWKRTGSEQSVALQTQTMAFSQANAVPAFTADMDWNGDQYAVRARNVSLSALQYLWPSLPLPTALGDALRDYQPRGVINDLQLRWYGNQPSPQRFSVATRFTNVQLAANGKRPGVTHLSGSIRGDEKSGVFDMNGNGIQIAMPEVFREVLNVDNLGGRGAWKKRGKNTLITIDKLDFANADAAGSAQGNYEIIPGHAGKVDITGRLTRGNGIAVYRYLPKTVHDETVNWVRRAIVAGTSDDTRLTLKGDLSRFPFNRDQGGIFKVEVIAKNAVLDYVEGWPRIENAKGSLTFHGSRLEVHAEQARIFNTQLTQVTAVLPDLHNHEAILEINGQAIGGLQDVIRFANVSPVAGMLNNLTQGMEASGNTILALNLKIPLHHALSTTLGGRLSFQGNNMTLAGVPRLDEVKGDALFTHDSFNAPRITAQLLGGPLSLAASARYGRMQLQAQGRARAANLAVWLNQPWGQRLSGEAQWRGQLVMDHESTQMRVESDLAGLESRLPAPLNKSAAQKLPAIVSHSSLAGRDAMSEIQLDRTLGVIWQTGPDKRVSRGELRFGGPAKLPQEPGWRLSGSGRGLALTEWFDLMPRASDAADVQISSIDLNFSTLNLMNRHFSDVRVQGRNRNGLLRLAVNGRDMNGTLSYRPPEGTAQGSSARISAQFKQLSIPAAGKSSPQAAAATSPSDNVKASEMPSLDLLVEDFRLDNRALGRLDATAHGAPQGMVIDSLQLAHPDSVVRMSGLWRDAGLGETQAKLQVEILDAGRMLSRFGFKDAIKRGVVDINGDVSWAGAPVDFDFQTLAGALSLKARNGQFQKVEPGVAKLLGVLSLQSLPRRLSFDFRDIFNDGFAFDEISATMLIARGVVYSDDFRMKGPAAKVAMTGLANLTDETVQMRVKVTPKLSESVAVAGALIGGPIAGLG